MKKIILSFAFSGTIIFSGFAQTKSVKVDSKEYEQMKKNGQIDQDVKLISPNTFAPSIEDLKKFGEVHKMGGASASCSCYITPDATYSVAMAPNDDGSTGLLNIPFNFCLYGNNYSSLYINNNGNISFGAAYATFSSFPFPDPGYIMVAPFWGDVDTRGTGVVKYKITPTAMYVNWEAVGYYSSYTDKVNTFQLIITDGTDPILPAGNNIAFCYGDMQWTTGDASGGAGTGFGGTPATVGVNQGSPGLNYIQMGRFDQPGIAYDGGYGANDGVSWLDNQSFYFNSCNSTNIAPIASGLNNCDTIRICGAGDTLILNGLFLSPEIGQNTNLVINLNSTPGASIVSNTPGNSANGQVQIIASAANAGNNVITFTATDNGTPAGTTTVNVNVFVDTTGLFAFNPMITGNLEFCEGSSSVLSVTPATFDSYYWSTGASTTSITVDSSGQYWVTSSENGCYKTNLVDVVVNPSPTPIIAGYPYACGGTTDLYSDSLIYATYSWSNSSTNDSVNVGFGTYTLTVTDTNGCVGTSPPVTVTAPALPVITGITAFCNGDSASLTTTIPYVTYNWSTGSTNDSITVGTSGPYTVTVVDINGCTITSSPFSVSPFTYSLSAGGVTTFCANDSILLTASGTPAAGASYSWSNGDNTSSTFVGTGGPITVTLSYANGCTADTTMNVPVPNPAPTPLIVGPLFTCSTNSTTIYVDSALLYSSITWSNASTNDTVITNSGTYTVTVTQNGCSATSPPVTVVNANPVVDIIGNLEFCPGDSSSLFASLNLPSGAAYTWSTTETTSAISVNSNGTYYVEVNYSNGCSTTDTVVVTQYGAPNANFSSSPSNSAFLGTATQFTDLSTVSPGSITSWFWDFGDNDSTSSYSLLENPIHTYAETGTYTVTLVVQTNNGCRDTIRYEYTIISELQIPNVFTPNGDGKNDLLAFKNIEYFPNTALTIYNRWGNKIYTSTDYRNDWNGGGHSDGVYYFILEGPQLKETKYGYVQIFNE
jgi:gliding motility-associated-like protein